MVDRGLGCGVTQICVQITAVPLMSCEVFGSLFNFLGLRFPIIETIPNSLGCSED